MEGNTISSKTLPNLNYSEPNEMTYAYRIMSVRHFPMMQNFVNQLMESGILSDNSTYRGYLNELSFTIPDSIPDAKSVIIIAVFTPLGLVNFHYRGEKYEITIPPQYYRLGITRDQLKDIIRDTIIHDDGYNIEFANSYLFLKSLAAFTGLAKYGRNNICYVEEMGSMISLHAFLTNYEFEEDHFSEMRMMEHCESCKICMINCPTNAIKEDNFVVDISKCVTLYNEVDDEFPDWIQPEVHNSLMGCMKCQNKCPANREVILKTIYLEDITEEETEQILKGTSSPELLESLSRKLRGFYPATSEESFQIFTRNLRMLIPNEF